MKLWICPKAKDCVGMFDGIKCSHAKTHTQHFGCNTAHCAHYRPHEDTKEWRTFEARCVEVEVEDTDDNHTDECRDEHRRNVRQAANARRDYNMERGPA